MREVNTSKDIQTHKGRRRKKSTIITHVKPCAHAHTNLFACINCHCKQTCILQAQKNVFQQEHMSQAHQNQNQKLIACAYKCIYSVFMKKRRKEKSTIAKGSTQTACHKWPTPSTRTTRLQACPAPESHLHIHT